jgi:hypothetical protein
MLQKALDTQHYQSRLSSFFIIILGEGVLQLVKNGPLGRGLSGTTGDMTLALLIYYEFSFLYFNRDGSLKFIPAVRKRGPRMMAWVFWHIPLFSSLLVFTASIIFIIRNQPDKPFSPGEGEAEGRISAEELSHYIQRAIWTAASSLSTSVICMTVIALLDKSMDEPKTLKVDNRYIRLSMRAVFVVVVQTIPAAQIGSQLFLGMAALMLFVVSVWEWNAGLDYGGQFVEPKGLTMMWSREMKG